VKRAASSAGFLYAIVFSDGCVKIGRAANAEARIGTHKAAAKGFGLTVSGFYSTETANMRAGELAALSAAKSLPGVTARVGEWFSGLSFDDAKACVDIGAQAQTCPFTPAPNVPWVRPPLEFTSVSVRQALSSLSQEQLMRLASLSGVPFTTLYKIQRGETKNPGIDTVGAFFRHLPAMLDLVEAAARAGAPS
jgi:hypothetical protein